MLVNYSLVSVHVKTRLEADTVGQKLASKRSVVLAATDDNVTCRRRTNYACD